eukprot:11230503-Alexandrium_andersonii.AAC.1
MSVYDVWVALAWFLVFCLLGWVFGPGRRRTRGCRCFGLAPNCFGFVNVCQFRTRAPWHSACTTVQNAPLGALGTNAE